MAALPPPPQQQPAANAAPDTAGAVGAAVGATDAAFEAVLQVRDGRLLAQHAFHAHAGVARAHAAETHPARH